MEARRVERGEFPGRYVHPLIRLIVAKLTPSTRRPGFGPNDMLGTSDSQPSHHQFTLGGSGHRAQEGRVLVPELVLLDDERELAGA